MQISARNQISVTIKEIEVGAVNSVVLAQTISGMTLGASITNSSVENMGLKVGDSVIFFFKASNVLISTDLSPTISARNKLSGKIKEIKTGAVNSEVIMSIGHNDEIISVVTNDAVVDLKLKSGDNTVAIIKASEVMVAK